MSEAAERFAEEMAGKVRTAAQWFEANPEAKADCVMLLVEKGLSRGSVRGFLAKTYGFPFRDEKSVNAALDTK